MYVLLLNFDYINSLFPLSGLSVRRWPQASAPALSEVLREKAPRRGLQQVSGQECPMRHLRLQRDTHDERVPKVRIYRSFGTSK